MKSTVLLVCLTATVGILATAVSKSDEQGKDATSLKSDASNKFIGKKSGDIRDDNALKMKLVWCPPGIFAMEITDYIEDPSAEEKPSQWSDDEFDATEEPAKTGDGARDNDDVEDNPAFRERTTTEVRPAKVFLKHGYWLGRCEVTQSEWKQVMATEPWKGKNFLNEGDDFPVTSVSWDDAMQFCHKLTEQERKESRLPVDWEYSLPTEAQWERACRARTETKFSFGDDPFKLGDYAWFNDNSRDARQYGARAVGRKKPNPWGLHDMHGNVWEWCRDVYNCKLSGGIDPEATKGGSTRVFRGGSWYVIADSCRSAVRVGADSSFRDVSLGFRVALSRPGNKKLLSRTPGGTDAQVRVTIDK